MLNSNEVQTQRTKTGQLVNLQNATDAELQHYFQTIVKLQKAGKPFPVKLEEVWPLVYSAKEKAVRALKQNTQFIEGFDYQVLAQNGEQDFSEKKHGGHNRVDYELSVSCLEFFVAKKVRRVFEVYRNVFHQAVQPKKGVKLFEYEKPIFEALKTFLVRGDIKNIAEQLDVSPKSVSRVKRGIFRSGRIMDALLQRCKENKANGLVDGYGVNRNQLALDLFNENNQLNLSL